MRLLNNCSLPVLSIGQDFVLISFELEVIRSAFINQMNIVYFTSVCMSCVVLSIGALSLLIYYSLLECILSNIPPVAAVLLSG